MQIQREIDLLKFQINEIESANLSNDEYEELLKQRDVYRNSEKYIVILIQHIRIYMMVL